MLTETDLHLLYERLDIQGAVRDEIEEIRVGAPARQVGRGALDSHSPDLFSRRNAALRQLESASVEMAYALRCELDPDVLGYWCQPGLKNIERNGRTSSTTADFLVYRKGGISIVECKKPEKLRKLCAEESDEWMSTQAGWSRPPLQAWARTRRLTYEIWAPPEPHGIYLANIQLLYDRLDQTSNSARELCALNALQNALSKYSLSIADALDALPSLTGELVIRALATRRCHGTLMSIPLDNFVQFRLYGEASHAEKADLIALEQLRDNVAQISVDDPVLNATPVDYREGQRRLARVMSFIETGRTPSRYWNRLHRQVLAALANGTSPLAPCITRYSHSGRRVRQLTHTQLELLREHVRRYVGTAEYKNKKQAHLALVRDCRMSNIRPPSYPTLLTAIKKESVAKRALSVEGRRGYQAKKPAVDPTQRRLAALSFGLTAHIDSTTMDGRYLALLAEYNVKERPVLYVAVDEATNTPVARAIVFGRACRDYLAMLIRDFVYRQGFLPRYLVADRGSEYTSGWFRELCTSTGMTWLKHSAGAARNNSEAENLLGRVNQQVAHMLTGSTAPDRQNRRVDSKFKSYATARHTFREIVRQVDCALFEDFANSPLGLRPGAPGEQEVHMIEQLGRSGIRTAYDDAFIVLTSIPLDGNPRIDPVSGIRHLGRTYSSRALLARAVAESAIETRRDCISPAKLYVKFRSGWVTAFASDVAKIEVMDDASKLFETLLRPYVAKTNRERQQAIAEIRFDRVTLSNASAAATEHLSASMDDESETIELDEDPWAQVGVEIEPYKR